MRGVVAALALALTGCGFMQVGERPIPSVAGSVAATVWQSQETTLPELDDGAGGATTPEAFLELLIPSLIGPEQLAAGGVHYGVLGRSGDEAAAYLQLTGASTVNHPVVALEAHLTLGRAADGTWSLRAVETREHCAEPLTNGACGDNSGGGGAPEAAPTEPASP